MARTAAGVNGFLTFRAGDELFGQPQNTIQGLDVIWDFGGKGTTISTNDVTDQVYWQAPSIPGEVTVTCTNRYDSTQVRTAKIDVIRLDKVRMYLSNLAGSLETEHATILAPTPGRVVVWATFKSQKPYTLDGFDFLGYAPGYAGDDRKRMPARQESIETEPWPVWWPSLAYEKQVLLHWCTAYQAPSDRKYDYTRASFTTTPADQFAVNHIEGTSRLWASVTMDGTTVPSLDAEEALRISCQRLDTTLPAIVRFAVAWKDTPYQYGGKWFGGRISPNAWVGQGQRYAVDCSGFIQGAAYMAGYSWAGGGDMSTYELSGHSTEIPASSLAAGDILVRLVPVDARHVVLVTRVGSDGLIDIIEAAGNEASIVRVLESQDLVDRYTSKGFVPRRLNP